MTNLKNLWTSSNKGEAKSSSSSCLMTSVKEIDDFLGSGIPKHKIIEFVGDVDSFKSFLALKISTYLTNQDKIVFYISLDGDINASHIEFMKINLNNFYILNTNNIEEIFDVLIEVSKNIDLLVIDSIASLDYKKSANLLNVISKLLLKSDLSCIVINQFRQSLENGRNVPYINKVLNQICSMRVKLSKVNNIVKKYETVGYKIKLEYIRNKIGDAEKTTVLKLLFKE